MLTDKLDKMSEILDELKQVAAQDKNISAIDIKIAQILPGLSTTTKNILIKEDEDGSLRDVPCDVRPGPQPSKYGRRIFYTRQKKIGRWLVMLINSASDEIAYRAKWGLEPLEEVEKDET
nr:MAG TPA: hypothetical protein [Caudoviricetes sp.]